MSQIIKQNSKLHTEEMLALKAIQTNNLKHFLVAHFTFRAWINFKDSDKRRTFYGNEHNCTLNQLIAGHKDQVVLDKYKGLDDLIKLIEKTWRGKWKSARIFMRENPGEGFDKEIRRYYNGQIEDEQSPVLKREFEVLYFHGISGYQPIFKKDPPPDFKKELAKNLA